MNSCSVIAVHTERTMSCARKSSMKEALMPAEVALKICGSSSQRAILAKSESATHPRDTAKHVPHIGEQDAADQGESDQSRPGGDVQLDVEDDGEARQERGEKIGSLRRRCSLCRSVLMGLSRVAEDEVDDRLRGTAGECAR